MKRQTRLVQALVALITVAGGGLAEAGVIFPVDQTTGVPILNSTVTISLFDASGNDITDTWLPTWEPNRISSVNVGFNVQGAPVITGATATLKGDVLLPATLNGLTNPFVKAPAVNNGQLLLATSRYPGRCTNYGAAATSPAAEPLDYDLAAANPLTVNGVQRQVFLLTSQDCGGIAVMTGTVNGQSYLATIPQDSNLNGIPDIWERQFCPNNACPVGNEDNDTGPVVGTPTGDGIAAFDEFRGFIVSNVHVSTDPRQRDLFVHLVNAQCGAAANSLLGGGATTYPTDGSSVFANLASLVPGSQVHVLGYPPTPANPMTPEWVDRFSSFSQQTGFVYSDGTSTAPADDRRINANAIFPLGVPNLTTGPIQKGLRVTECLDVSAPQPLGTTGIGSTNGPDNSLVYTQRIVSYINGMVTAGGTRPLKLFVFQNGAWAATFTGTGAPTDADRNVILSQAMKYYVAHELAHSTRLTPTVEGTRQTSYGYHHAPGTGSVMDQTITQKIDKSTSGFNSFYIPSTYNGSDQSNYKILD